MLSQRFIPALRYTWLALKRNNCYRDIRHKIVQLVKRNQFAWETNLLVFERMHTAIHLFQLKWRRRYIDCIVQIQNTVDLCVAGINDDSYNGCILQRVKVRIKNYSPGKWHWYWLQNQQ